MAAEVNSSAGFAVPAALRSALAKLIEAERILTRPIGLLSPPMPALIA